MTASNASIGVLTSGLRATLAPESLSNRMPILDQEAPDPTYFFLKVGDWLRSKIFLKITPIANKSVSPSIASSFQ